MATIEHHVRQQGFWADEGLQSRMPLRICREDRRQGVHQCVGSRLGLPCARHARRLEIVVDGLPFHGGVQLAVDTTLVSVLKGDGTVLGRGNQLDGVALRAARRRKERTYPELVRPSQRAKLVVLAGEVAGRWSEETASFLMREANLQCCRRGQSRHGDYRWGSLLACAAARAFACSLLEKRVSGGVDGDTPSVHEALGECRFAGLEAA